MHFQIPTACLFTETFPQNGQLYCHYEASQTRVIHSTASWRRTFECCAISIFFTTLRILAPYRVPYLPTIPAFFVRFPYTARSARTKSRIKRIRSSTFAICLSEQCPFNLPWLACMKDEDAVYLCRLTLKGTGRDRKAKSRCGGESKASEVVGVGCSHRAKWCLALLKKAALLYTGKPRNPLRQDPRKSMAATQT